jgi:hypothetical protein
MQVMPVMQAQPALVTFSEAERPLGDRLLKIAVETDRVEGYSEPHALAIARLAEKIGAQMGLHGIDLTALKFAALAHDLGERAMKRNYLLQPGPLGWEETLDLWRHPILGEQAAGELRLSRQTQLLIRWHHEWWNGLGYPDGLAGEAIPVGARILRAVDSFFALGSDRPHRARFDRIEAEQIVADLAGIEFDPQIVKLLLAVLAEEKKSQEIEFQIAPPAPEPAFVFVEPELEAVIAEFAGPSVEPQSAPEIAAAVATAVDESPATWGTAPGAIEAAPDEIASVTQPATAGTEPLAHPDGTAEDRTLAVNEAGDSAGTPSQDASAASETEEAPEPKIEDRD